MGKHLIYITGMLFLLSCLKELANEAPPDDSQKPREPYITMSDPEFTFGFIGKSKYSYCPSALEQENGSVHLFFCGNPDNMVMVDNIFHIKINPDGTKTKPKSVLQPGESGSWDDQHTCDPSVVEGSFLWNDSTYKYAMFFLGSKCGVFYNEIGVAFSNQLDADSWNKYPEQIVKKTWSSEGDQMLGNGNKSWGVGQPSAVSLDEKGKVLLTYTVGDISGTRIVWSEAEFSDVEHYTLSIPQTMVKTGLMAIDNKSRDITKNADFAINKSDDKILMIRPVQPNPKDYPSKITNTIEINHMGYSDFKNQTGSWIRLYRISHENTGYPRNHNPALLRDNFGHINNWEEPEFYYTVSKSTPEVKPASSFHAEWTYHIWKGKLNKR